MNNVQKANELNENLVPDPEDRAAPSSGKQVAAEGGSGISRVLRIAGGAAILASAATFLMQEWSSFDHLMRFFCFLAFTGVLGVVGFFCGLKIHEDKGARTFLAIAALIVPVNFCQLGALIHSRFGQLESFTAHIPSYFYWVAPDPASVLLAAGVACLVLVPVILAAFSALCRPQALPMTLGYVLLNAALLVPLRDANVIGIIGLTMLVALVVWNLRSLRTALSLKTREGRLCKWMLFVPFAMLAGRSLNLYPTSLFFFSMLLAAAAVFFFVFIPSEIEDDEIAGASQVLGACAAGLAWYCFVGDMLEKLIIAGPLCLPALCLPYAALLFGMSIYARRYGAFLRGSAILTATMGMLVQLVVEPGVLSSILLILVSTVDMTYGYAASRKYTFSLGVFGFGTALVYHLRYAVELYSMSPWITLGIAGILIVVASSLLERNYPVLVEKFKALRERFDARETSVRSLATKF